MYKVAAGMDCNVHTYTNEAHFHNIIRSTSTILIPIFGVNIQGHAIIVNI